MTDLPKKKEGVSLRDKIYHKSTTTMLINGHEVIISDYMKNPEYYNKLPMKEEFVQEIIEAHEIGVKTKKELMRLNKYDQPE